MSGRVTAERATASHRDLLALQHLTPERALGASANSAARHEVERVVEQLVVGAVQQGDGGRLAPLGGLQEGGVVHGGPARG